MQSFLQNHGLKQVHAGTLTGASNSSNYIILNGHNPFLSIQADIQWQTHYAYLFNEISLITTDPTEIQQLLSTIVMQDSHWKWFDKSIALSTSDYEWFFLIADNEIQGIALIYHPKQAELETGNIFYVEFVAVAPWNRANFHSDKKYEKVGSILLKAACDYSQNTLKLKPGFSLHSLPQSESYYIKIGMQEIPKLAKKTMKFFEMDKATHDIWRTTP